MECVVTVLRGGGDGKREVESQSLKSRESEYERGGNERCEGSERSRVCVRYGWGISPAL